MREIKIKYDLVWIMTRAAQLRKSGDDKSTAMKKAWAEEKDLKERWIKSLIKSYKKEFAA